MNLVRKTLKNYLKVSMDRVEVDIECRVEDIFSHLQWQHRHEELNHKIPVLSHMMMARLVHE